MIVTWEHSEIRTGVWNVTFLNAKGDYELTGPHPVQGVGSICGVDFYFRAKSNEWEFETNDPKGWLYPEGDIQAMQRRGRCESADTMPLEKAAQTICECVTEFVSKLRQSSTLREEDVRIDVGRASHGGDCMRIQHVPTGIERWHPGPLSGVDRDKLVDGWLREIKGELIEKGLAEYLVPEYARKNRRQSRRRN